MRKRNADGTFRSARKALRVSERIRIARWVEAQTLRLKRLGLSFDAIAEQITKVGRGEARGTGDDARRGHLPARLPHQPAGVL
jgi:hypothetical protein